MIPQRSILHVDMDMFYVAVELRDNPDLRGLPVVVGGDGPRGVVAAASYEARRFGVFSAMSSAQARRLCPNALFLSGRPSVYREVSEQVHGIFARYTPLIEGISLDEAFLDVTGALRLHGSALVIADAIRARVADEIGITCSVGVAANKFVAKIASKAAKPRVVEGGIDPGAGVVIVESGREVEFLHPLPVRALWGVGPATHARLDRIGVKTVGDLATIGVDHLVVALGEASGRQLFDLAWGRDDRPVESDREAKSIGHEETFLDDVFDAEELRRHMVRLCEAVAIRVRAGGLRARTMTLKIKFANFRSITRSITLDHARESAPGFVDALAPLLAAIEIGQGVRLLGVSASQLENADEPSGPVQASLFDDVLERPTERRSAVEAKVLDEATWANASGVMDEIRRKFGGDAIRTVGALRDAEELGEVGENPWGRSS
ncbi:MAG: DNA polymerase IV [Ilumatobacteraceae bacterium]|nr:DNA polymerase IV [Ilumatobacteraceae bacterium]